MQWDLIGWIACCMSLLGAALATSYTRRIVFWGWLLFFVGNVCWAAYGISVVAIPLVIYNILRAIFSLRGAHNNTLKRKQAIKEQRKIKECPQQ